MPAHSQRCTSPGRSSRRARGWPDSAQPWLAISKASRETAQPLEDAGVSGLHIEAIEAQLEAYRLALEGRGPEAGLLFSSAAEMLRRLGSVLELALLAVARATLIRPADAATLAAVSEAREILTRLGAVPLLALLDAAVGGGGVAAGAGSAAGADPGQARTTSAEPSSASRASS